MSGVTLVRDEGGEWEALYVDGRLVYEGHSLSTDRVLGALGVVYTSHVVDMGDGAPCPQELNPGRLPDEPPW